MRRWFYLGAVKTRNRLHISGKDSRRNFPIGKQGNPLPVFPDRETLSEIFPDRETILHFFGIVLKKFGGNISPLARKIILKALCRAMLYLKLHRSDFL